VQAFCRGQQIHDAHIVATALEHGVAGLVTENTSDFVRSGDLLEIVDLRATSR